MYGNIESSRGGQGLMWVLGSTGGEATSDVASTEENPYEPLDPVPSQKPDAPGAAWPKSTSVGENHVAAKAGAPQLRPVPAHPPSSESGRRSREKLVLVGAVALGVSVLLNVLFLAVGSRHVTALTDALEAAKAKELLTMANLSAASCSFLLYNRHHHKCVTATRDHQLTAEPCRPEAPTQRFHWLPGGRLRSWESRRCVTALLADTRAIVKLETCREDGGGKLQRWECRDGGLLALAGHPFYFNYGNNAKGTVMLWDGTGEWSRWFVYGSKDDDICSRSCCSPCSKVWTVFGNSYYFHAKTTSSWEDARSFCSVLGMQLLEVDGPEEKNYVRIVLRSSSWLGITDEEVEGTWKRANGTIVPRESGSWHRNEPNGGTQENCAVVREDGEWYDYPCAHKLPWVCEGNP